MLLRVALPEYIPVPSDRQVINSVIAQNYVFFPFSGKAIARKMLSQKGRIKDVYTTLRFLRVYFYRCHPEVGWGQGEIVCEGYWLKTLI